MNTFLITFEILFPSLPVQNQIIIDAIKSFGYWAKPTSSVWLIKTYSTKEDVINRLRSSAGPNDKILVMRVGNDWIATHLSEEIVNWMKSGL